MTPQHPFDIHSHLAWLREKELDALNIQANSKDFEMQRYWGSRAVAFREVIDHVENQPKLLHRCMVPVGWDTIDP